MEQAGLTGFRFAEIWDSENEYWPIHDPKAVLFDFFSMPMSYSNAMKLVYERQGNYKPQSDHPDG